MQWLTFYIKIKEKGVNRQKTNKQTKTKNSGERNIFAAHQRHFSSYVSSLHFSIKGTTLQLGSISHEKLGYSTAVEPPNEEESSVQAAGLQRRQNLAGICDTSEKHEATQLQFLRNYMTGRF